MAAQGDDDFSPGETRRRAEAALRAAFGKPAKSQSEMKLGGNARERPRRSPGKRKAVRKPGR
jgi:hypothetical protein